jgi:hypothetical protein
MLWSILFQINYLSPVHQHVGDFKDVNGSRLRLVNLS